MYKSAADIKEIKRQIKQDLEADPRFVVAFEYNQINRFKSDGYSIQQTDLNKATLVDAVDTRLKYNVYGPGVFCKLVPLTDEEASELLKKLDN